MQQSILQLITQAFTSQENDQRQGAEKQVIAHATESLENFQIIAAIAEAGDQMHEQAALLLNTVIQQMFISKATFTINHVITVCSILASQKAKIRVKQHLNKAMGILIKVNKETRLQVENQMKLLIKSEQLVDIQSGILLFKALVDSLDLQGFNFIVMTDMNLSWISEFMSGTLQLAINLQKQQELNPELLATVKLYSQVVFEFCDKVFKVKHQSKEALLPLQNHILYSAPFSTTLMALLQYSIQKGTQISQNIISCTSDPIIDDTLNEIKCNCLKSYSGIINILLNFRNKAEQRRGVFLPQMPQTVQILLYSILTYVSSQQIPVLLSKPFMSQIITNILKILANCGSQTELYQIYSDSKISLITEVVYPFLVTTQDEYKQMVDDPDEFVNLALDTVDKQESEVPKTAAATLLETLCDHIDGSTSFLAQLAIFIVQQSIREMTQSQQPINEQEQQFIQAIKEKKIFTEFSAIDRIESSLSLLTVMSYLIQKRQDIIALMEKLLIENLQFFLNLQQQIVKVRLALFFGYFCDNLFKTEQHHNNMIQYLQILIGFVQPQQPAVLYQAIDALKDVFEDEELKKHTRPLIIQVFPPLIQGLTFSTYERHFEMVTNLVKTEPKIFVQHQDELVKLIQVLCQRVLQEQHLINNGNKTRYIYINRCWNIIRALAEINELIPVLPLIESNLLVLYEMIQHPTSLDFEEEILLLISSMIEKLKSVSLLQKQLLPYFDMMLQKQHDRLNNLYELLNLYMTFGKEIFKEEQYQQIYLSLAIRSMTATQEFICETDQAEGALLIQLAIQTLGTDLNRTLLQNVFQVAIKQLQSDVRQGYLRGRIVGIFLSSLYIMPKVTYEVLSTMFDQVYQLCLQTSYQPGYDIKLFIITMSNLILQEPTLFNTNVIHFMTTNLVKQREKENENKSHFEESFDDEMNNEEDEEYEEEEERQQAQLQIEQFKSQIIEMDEYSEFSKMIHFIKNNHPQLIEKLRVELDQTTFKQLQDSVSCMRIETSDGTFVSRQIVKVVQRKQKH